MNHDDGRRELNESTVKSVAESTASLTVMPAVGAAVPATAQAIADIPEEEIWLASLKSRHTRRAYRNDVRHFMRVIGITTQAELRSVTYKHVVAWDHYMREFEGRRPSSATVRRRLSALSSLFSHLIQHAGVDVNPVREIKRPPADQEGQTPAFARKEARAVIGRFFRWGCKPVCGVKKSPTCVWPTYTPRAGSMLCASMGSATSAARY